MRKQVSFLLAAAMAAGLLAGCGGSSSSAAADTTPAADSTSAADTADAGDEVSITLATYPIGKWGDSETVDGLIASFNAKYPNIKVTVQYLDYTNGDDQVNTAIEGGQAPDVIMEGPERLVANWGAKGLMVDLADLWDGNVDDIYESVEAACKGSDGVYYEYPLCMTAHTMVVNRDIFEAADALQYLDEETRTWTTENFFKAVQAVYDYGHTNVGAVFCSGQGGDQGTRALINNLYGGTFTDAAHTKYTADSDENIKAIEALYNADGINFDASIAGGDEVQLFCNGTLAMGFCWNVAQEANNAEVLQFDALPMAFPTDSGDPQLCGGIWGFGIFDNGDDARIDASKTFIDFIANDETQLVDSVKASTYWSVRKSQADLWEGDELMSEYATFVPYMGDYYQVVPGWAEARTAWWNMLQQVGSGTDVATAVNEFVTTANAAAGA